MHAEIRANVLERFRNGGDEVPTGSILLLQGGAQATRDDTDHEPVFRQESNFHYLFGVKEPGSWGLIECDTGKSILFVERLPEIYQIWMGKHMSLEEYKNMYKVDEVKYADELTKYFDSMESTSEIHVIKGLNTDSGNEFVPPTLPKGVRKTSFINGPRFFNSIVEARVFKTDAELDLMRHVNIVSSEAHLSVMQHCRPGLAEYQLESLFQHWCYYNGGARFSAYTCICGSGPNCAALHYGHAGAPNERTLKDGDMCLHDMGGEYHCYASDITNSFPCNGKFSEDQKIVYRAVLAANWGVMKAMRPGVSWVDMHTLSYRLILEKLRDGGIVKGDIDAMMAANLGSVFMPHGLGHFMGKDTHDVGGYLSGHPERPKEFGYKSLRTARILEKGMVITVEPGVYFIDYVLDRALENPEQASFFVLEVLQRFRGSGGCRLEDDVLITDNGIENLTWAPRTIEDVEAVCQGRAIDRFSFEAPFCINHNSSK
eukprot:UC4_evm2s704